MARALWFRFLLLNLPTLLTGFFWTTWILLQIPDVFLDPGTAGVDTEILALFGDKSMEQTSIISRMSKGILDHLWAVHLQPCGQLKAGPLYQGIMSQTSGAPGSSLSDLWR